MADASTFDKTYDVRSVKSMTVIHHIAALNRDIVMTGFASGSGLTVQLDAEEITNTPDFYNNPHYLESGGKTSTATFNLLVGSDDDIQFQAEHNNDKGKGDAFIYTDSSTGERITITDAIITTQVQGDMNSTESTKGWQVKGILKRTFDGKETIDKAVD